MFARYARKSANVAFATGGISLVHAADPAALFASRFASTPSRRTAAIGRQRRPI